MEWEWENHEIFTSKVITASPKKLQSSNWEDGINESFNLSASDVVNNSSTKSSISASAESSFKENMTMSKLSFGEFIGGEVNGKSPLLETSVSSGEPFISLKLGKRTYFENNFGRSDCKMSSFSNIPMLPVSSTGKKAKSSFQSTLVPRCQVEGCDLDLSSVKEYHRKHRVCESHSKCPRVVVSGLERRFCQQCSRFHSLGEFDEKKRSCRRRLSDHNARRRKPQQETIQFNSTNQSSSFYGFKDSSSPNVDALRALSLLSNNSWGLYEPDLTGLDQRQSMDSDIPPMHQGLPLSTPDYWQTEQQDIHAKTSNPANSQFQEFQLFSHFHSNPMDGILKPL